MVRPLAELTRPWLTREQLEAGFWRVTGTRNSGVIAELLRMADVYAASQGPALAEEVIRRNEERGRFSRTLDFQLIKPRLSQEPANHPELPQPYRPRHSLKLAELPPPPPLKDAPENATAVWEENGIPYQRCTKCKKGKPYDEFHRDSNRWNLKATQCKECKNTAQRGRQK